MSDIAQRIDASAIANLRVSQWDDAPRLQALIRGLLDLVADTLGQPLEDMEVQIRYTTATGVWLDYAGHRIGCLRPSVLDDSFDRFAFGDAGVGWGQGPWATTQEALTSREPLGDQFYRCFVEFCAHAILSDGSRPSLEAALQCTFPTARVQDHADGTVTVHNVGNDPRPNLATLATPFIERAMPAGISVTVAT